MLGISLVPIDTDQLRVWLQWNRGMNIFDAPTMSNTYFGNTAPRTNLGDIDWYGAGVMKTFKGVGPGNLNVFADAGVSVTHPNQNVSSQFGFQGLLTGAFFQPEAPSSKTGNAIAVGLRYDLPSKTKLGLRVQPRLQELDHVRARRRRHVDLEGGRARQRLRGLCHPGARAAPPFPR